MRPVYYLLTFSILLFSCKKEKLLKNSSSEYFPNKVGNYWKYKYVDSVSQRTVFVSVNITRTNVLANGQPANVWVYTFPDHEVTYYALQSGDTVRFFNLQTLSIEYTYVNPLVVHNKWRASSYIYDSIQVVQNHTYLLNHQPFENSFLLDRVGQLPNEYWNGTEWFCPHVGMLTRAQIELFTIASQRTAVYWELVEYDLK